MSSDLDAFRSSTIQHHGLTSNGDVQLCHTTEVMDVTHIYAITAGAIFGLILIIRVLFRPVSSTLQRIIREASLLPQCPATAPLFRTMRSSSSTVAPSLPGRQYDL